MQSGLPSGVGDDLIQTKNGASQFQNFRVNFHKFHSLSSMRLSQLG
jgi:hypothetical protein